MYDVQKDKFHSFSNEIQIFESIHNELDARFYTTQTKLLEKKEKRKRDSYYIGLLNEDYESNNIELIRKEKEKEELEKRIGAIERTYPKEFEYLYQDLVLKKELMEVMNERREINRKIKYKEDDIKRQKSLIEELEVKLEEKQKEKINLSFELDETRHDLYYRTMETYLEQNVSDIMKFEKFKILIQSKLRRFIKSFFN